MVRELRTPDQVGEIIDDLDFIARNLRDLRAAMISDGMATIELQDGTARYHLNWVKSWSETLMPGFRKEKIRLSAMAKRAEIEARRKKEKGRK